MVARRSRRRGSGEARNGMSLRDLVQLDLVAKGVEHVGPSPSRDGFGFFEARAALAQRLHGDVQDSHSQREMSARMKAELAIGREMDVTRRHRNPAPRAVAATGRAVQRAE